MKSKFFNKNKLKDVSSHSEGKP